MASNEEAGADEPAHPIRCNKCRSTKFNVEQLGFFNREYNSTLREWRDNTGPARLAYLLSVKCSRCEADCTALFQRAGWRFYDETTIEARE